MGKPDENYFTPMEPALSLGSCLDPAKCRGYVLDPEKCSRLSLEQKRELVHQIARWSTNAAPEFLSSWTRAEILEVICAEMGKERKYSGLTKPQMIDHLLKVVSMNSGTAKANDSRTLTGFKRQRQKEHLHQFDSDSDHLLLSNIGQDHIETQLCENVACQATLTLRDKFCKRCSCCICYKYDDNKDPSLWLICSSDHHNQDDSCGMSCHLECALTNEKAGIMNTGCNIKLDGGFYCVSCGKVNEILGCWRKQLLIAQSARRVDKLYHRLSLSHKILKGTGRFKEQQKILGTAVLKLKKEVGPLHQVCSNLERGIVNRLSCGAEVQKLCSLAIESFETMFPSMYYDRAGSDIPPSCNIRFEEASPGSVVVVLKYDKKKLEGSFGCRLWYRRSTVMYYPEKPAFLVLIPQTRFVISDLDPSTEYVFKVSMFNGSRELGVWEANYVTQASSRSSIVGQYEEQQKEGQQNSQWGSTNSSDNKLAYSDEHSKLCSSEDINKSDDCHVLDNTKDSVPIVSSTSAPPPTPYKSDGIHEPSGCGGKKHNSESNYEHCARIIRWLEREGHMKKEFRVKFLTWFSLKATMQDIRVVTAYVDTLIDEPSSLADQIVDTFTDKICKEHKKPHHQNGFCTAFWH
ncbi:VIN3-like protein 2 [Papaver somniferum]|uniref:VIN3-like protein 2 n=1 Tax=Papaver somniferum TaxID=3469 RepID=UPI000E6FDC8A|nr:VIN3-like protein 2 [Papaver somniferum]